ncbi:MAG: methyltransferase domain-containing protein [Chloroflexi bacterium]|nr:methyltransferase domain-containing protein [Chloroflexota bacterium]
MLGGEPCRGPRGEFVEGDAEALPFEDVSFDVVSSVIACFNRADDGTMVVPSEYLEAVIVKR